MHLRKTLCFLIGIGGLIISSGNVSASCVRNPDTPTKDIEMFLGRVTVQPDTPVGGTIATKTWDFETEGKKIYYRCSPGSYKFDGKILKGNDLGNKTYSTNVEGIGIRLTRHNGAVDITYPGSYEIDLTSSKDLFLDGSDLTIELIKTSETTGSGTITAGRYSSYDLKGGNNPILDTYLTASSITVVSPSCTVTSGNDMNVDMGSVSLKEFKGVGSVAGNRNFTIDLQCNGGVSGSGYTNIKTTFSGKMPENYTRTQGILANEKSGSLAAKGIGISIEKENTPVVFGEKYLVGIVNDQQRKNFTIPLTASYYQYDKQITAGDVESHMVFNLNYD